jgi:hypothetical protein
MKGYFIPGENDARYKKLAKKISMFVMALLSVLVRLRTEATEFSFSISIRPVACCCSLATHPGGHDRKQEMQ